MGDPAKIAAVAHRTRLNPAYAITTWPNGVRVVVHPMPGSQSVSVGAWVHAGGRYEDPTHAGISHFVEHLVFKGTRRWSCEALVREIEGVGGSLNGFTTEEFTAYVAKVPRRYAQRAVSVLAEMIRSPRLAAEDIEREREVILEEIRMYDDSPGQYVHDLFNQLLWPAHPLGELLSGTIDSVRRITRSELVAYWRRMYQARGLLVAAAGAIEPEAITRSLRCGFGSMRRARRPPSFLRAPHPRRVPQVRVWNKPTEQTHLCLGTYAVPRTHPDRFALELLHVILGGNMSSRLFREVRERRGLAYEVGTQIKRFYDTGAFVLYAGCDTPKLRATLETMSRELSRLRRQPVPAAELKRAKEYYAGQLVMSLEDTMEHMLWVGEQAAMIGRVGRTTSLLAHMERVTPRDIQRVARSLFDTDRMHLAVLGPVAETETSRLAVLCRIG